MVDISSLSLDDSTERWGQPIEERSVPLSPLGFPVPWESADVAALHLEASLVWRDASVRIESRAAVLGREEDACRFLYQQVDGDREIVARIGRCSASHPEARAGLMFRTSLAPSAPAVFFGINVAQGDVFEWRAAKGESTSSQFTPSLPGVRWYKLRREGEIFSAYRSRDGVRWLLAGRTNLALPAVMFVGLTAAGITDYRLHTAVFEHPAQNRRLAAGSRPRAELVSGSVVESPSLEFDRDGLRFAGVQQRPAVRLAQLARILFQPVPGRLEARLRIGQPGVLLTSGEFIEGDPRELVDGTLVLDSVTAGMQRLDVVNQVVAAVFRPVVRPPASSGVRMQDGSEWRSNELRIDGRMLEIHEPALGVCRLPLSDLAGLERFSR
jgi:hypothetical protein